MLHGGTILTQHVKSCYRVTGRVDNFSDETVCSGNTSVFKNLQHVAAEFAALKVVRAPRCVENALV